MRTIAFDTETFLLAPQTLAPRIVCLTYAFRRNQEIERYLTANGDGDALYDDCEDLLQLGEHRLVGHNVAYDLAVIAENFPALEPLIWAKLEAGEITDTMIREMLLNLSTHGNVDKLELEDGSVMRIEYHLANLVLERLGIDRSAMKTGPDIWRLNYHTLDGKPGRRYPREASEYALDDASDTLRVYEDQCEDKVTADGYASYGSEGFHTMAAFALYLISMRGMAVDKERFHRMDEWLEGQLNDDKLQDLIDAGIMDASIPERVNGGQVMKATKLLVEEKGLKAKTKILYRKKDALACSEAAFLKHREFLELHGIKFSKAKPSKINTVPLHERIEEVCEAIGERVKRTATGLVSAKDDVVAGLAAHDGIIKSYAARASLQKLVTTEMPRLQWPPFSGEPADVVHFKFSVLKNTGRTGSYGNNMKKAKADPSSAIYPAAPGQQFHKAIRPCYKAREGYALVSIDFNSMELATTAQTTLDIVGYSVHADKMRQGYDLHAYLGSQLAVNMDAPFADAAENAGFDLDNADEVYSYFLGLKKTDKKFFKWWRNFAKPVGLGYPGGLGPATFISIAGSTYYTDIYQIAEDRFDAHPDEFDAEEWAPKLLRHGKKIHKWKDVVDFEWTRQMKAFALATRLKEIWLETYPEMVEYFKHVSKDCKDHHTPILGTVWDADQEKEREIKGLCYTSPLGMHRAAAKFTEVANGLCMQTPGAEGAKWSVIDVVRATRTPGHILFGCFVVDFIHDELLVEVPLDTTNITVPEIQRLMTAAFLKVLPDIEVGTEAVLMIAWRKEAEPTFDDEGNLTIWEPTEDDLAA
jgi:hypothetical protein